jgi:hypothetical protein
MYLNRIKKAITFSTFTILINWSSSSLAATLTGTINFGNQPTFPSGIWTVNINIETETGKITNAVGIVETVVDIPSSPPSHYPFRIKTKDVTGRIWNWVFFENGSVTLEDNNIPSQLIRSVDKNSTNLSLKKHPIPEPTSTLSLLSLGILGAGATLKRQVKRSHSLEKEPSNVG